MLDKKTTIVDVVNEFAFEIWRKYNESDDEEF